MSDTFPSGVYTSLPELIRLKSQAKGFSFLPRQPVRSLLSGKHASKLRGRGLNFEEMRRYLPGDDIRQIDWKVTARTRKPHVRVYSEERERPVILVVDQRMSMFFGSRLNMKSVTAAEVTALAAWRTISVNDRVGAVIFNDSQIHEIRPQRTRSTVMQILQQVLELNQALHANSTEPLHPEMLNEALRRTRRLAPHDCLVLLITDGQGSNEETRQMSTEIARHNDILVAFVFDPLEADLPEAGPLIVSDGTRELEVDSQQVSLRKAFREDFAAIRAKAKHFLLTREVPVLPLSTAESTIDQIAGQLGAISQRAKR